MNSAFIVATVQFITQRPALHLGVVFVQRNRPRDGVIIIFDARLFHGVKVEVYRGVAVDLFALRVCRFNMDLIGRGNVAALQIRRKHTPIGQLVILILAKRGQRAGKALVARRIGETRAINRSISVFCDRDALCRIQLNVGHNVI